MGICLFCGLETERKLKYCNKKCSKQQYLKDRRIQKIKDRQIENLKCRICNTVITDTKKHYFCSKICQKIYTKENKRKSRILKIQICTNLECKKQKKQQKYVGINHEVQTIKCKCPKCEKIHLHTFTPAWIGNGIPKIFCPNCKFLKVPETYENIGDYNRCKM
jgi:predicted nucleic acid-binding Zn ribbon protein